MNASVKMLETVSDNRNPPAAQGQTRPDRTGRSGGQAAASQQETGREQEQGAGDAARGLKTEPQASWAREVKSR